MCADKIVMAAFDQGANPTIACINKATVELGVDFDALIAALQKFLPRFRSTAKMLMAMICHTYGHTG